MTFTDLIKDKDTPHMIMRKLEQLKFLRERPDFHPEPSAFHHIQIVTDRLAPLGDIDLTLAGLLHDICKFDTVKMNEKTGFPTSPGHDQAAHDLIMNSNTILSWIKSHHGGNPISVALICKGHMRFHQLGDMRPAKREAQIAEWTDQGIFDKLQIFGAADNMLEDFDINNLDKSFKFNRK